MICGIHVAAQNLVPNPSFEQYSQCPAFLNQLDHCVSWSLANIGTSDYYNTCANGAVGVPQNTNGYLFPATGNAYTGMITTHPSYNSREFIQCQLTENLLPGMHYHLSMKCAFDKPVTNCNVPGMYLSSLPPVSVFVNQYDSIFLFPVTPIPGMFVTANTEEWAIAETDYIATGGEIYLTIGNFWNNDQVIGVPTNTIGHNVSTYMFIDDVSIEMITSDTVICSGDSIVLQSDINNTYTWITQTNASVVLSTGPSLTVSPSLETTYLVIGDIHSKAFKVSVHPRPPVYLGNDTALCEGESLMLTAYPTSEYPNTQYTWQNGNNGPFFTPTQSGVYWVSGTLNGCAASDTILVTFDPVPMPHLGNDKEFCSGDTLILDATDITPNAIYQWQDGSSLPTFKVFQSGIYYVTVQIGGCSVSDSIILLQNPLISVNLGNDTSLCDASQLLLQPASSIGAAYVWQDASNTNTFTVTQTGMYSVVARLRECMVSDSIYVHFFALPMVYLGNDISPCIGTTVLLDAMGTDLAYQWNDGSTASTFAVQSTGTYTVQVTDSNGCHSSDGIMVNYIDTPQIDFVDSTLCHGDTWTLNITAPQATYLWSDKSTNSTYTIDEPGKYWAMATNACGMAVDSLNVYYRQCECKMYIPSAFTPDGDNNNEIFVPIATSDCELSEYTMGIYDRWGSLLYQTANPEQSWQGLVGGQIYPNGIYVYQITYRFATGPLTQIHGSVTLIR